MAYFQPTYGQDTSFSPPRLPYRLQAGDVLSVKYSGPDPIALAPFGAESNATPSAAMSNLQVFLAGYSVSDSGTVYLPVLGNFSVVNRTIDDAENMIQQRLNTMVRGAVARVRLVSFKVSVLGEVRTPGTYYIYNELLTLPEALGYAGDLTDAADRRQVRIVRRRQNKVYITTLDLTDRRLLGSPNFYLEPNDVVYVVPLSQKADRLNLPALSIGLSALSTVLIILNFATR
ncbi:polysaccharide biosynthesis/export family protein [Nostoc sp. NIES-2111]